MYYFCELIGEDFQECIVFRVFTKPYPMYDEQPLLPFRLVFLKPIRNRRSAGLKKLWRTCSSHGISTCLFLLRYSGIPSPTISPRRHYHHLLLLNTGIHPIQTHSHGIGLATVAD